MKNETNSRLSNETKEIIYQINIADENGEFNAGFFSTNAVKIAIKEIPKEAARQFYYMANLIANNHSDQAARNAIEEVDKALNLDDRFERAYFFRSTMKRRIKDYHGAIEDLESALLLNPKSSMYHEWLAFTHEEIKNRLDALEHYDEAIKLDPNNPRLLESRGTLKANRSDMRGSIADFTKAIKIYEEREKYEKD